MWYTGHMLHSGECHWLDRIGIPCGQPTITQVPAPVCEAHARFVHNSLTSALLAVQP